jgi:phosphotriesterase-related protein
MHEHVFVLSEEIRQNYAGDWDDETRVADAAVKLNALRARGCDTIVDPTVIGLGRDIARIKRVAARTDLNIIVAAGLYTYDDVPFYFRYRDAQSQSAATDPMTALFVGDLTEGIADTGVKAAFLKCAIEEKGLTPGVRRVLRAVGAAHLATGAPITVHAGCLLGMDRFGLDVLLAFEPRVDTVAELARRGYAGQMVLSHDASCYIDWFRPEDIGAFAPAWHFGHLFEDVLPALRDRGVTEAQIETKIFGHGTS